MLAVQRDHEAQQPEEPGVASVDVRKQNLIDTIGAATHTRCSLAQQLPSLKHTLLSASINLIDTIGIAPTDTMFLVVTLVPRHGSGVGAMCVQHRRCMR